VKVTVKQMLKKETTQPPPPQENSRETLKTHFISLCPARTKTALLGQQRQHFLAQGQPWAAEPPLHLTTPQETH
jgi:hypothetical protein